MPTGIMAEIHRRVHSKFYSASTCTCRCACTHKPIYVHEIHNPPTPTMYTLTCIYAHMHTHTQETLVWWTSDLTMLVYRISSEVLLRASQIIRRHVYYPNSTPLCLMIHGITTLDLYITILDSFAYQSVSSTQAVISLHNIEDEACNLFSSGTL